jgi:ribosomal protein L17
MSANKKTKGNAKGQPADQKLDRRNKVILQVIILVTVLITLGAISFTAFSTSKTTFRSTMLGMNKASEVSSMTDAKLACDVKVKNKYGSSLQSALLNSLSSRYEDDFGGYKLFYDASVYRNKNRRSGINRVIFKCFILNDGDVTETGIIKSTPPRAKARRKIDDNIFGF